MIPWETVYPALKEWVRRGSGLDQVVLVNEPRPRTKLPAWGTIQVLSVEAHGMDDRSLVDVPVTVAGVTTVHTRERIQGQRTFVLRVSVESSSQRGDGVATGPLERLRSTWELDEMQAILSGVNCALATFGQSQMADVEVDEHVFSAWFADVEINAAFALIHSADIDTIESVTATSNILETDGETPVPDALQLHA